MTIKDLSPDLFDDGIPTLCYGEGVERKQRLKPAKMLRGCSNQVLWVDNGYVSRAVVGGYLEDGFCEEFDFDVPEKPVKILQTSEVSSTQSGGGIYKFPKELPSEEQLDAFRKYVSRFSWIVARTFENFSPHQYIRNFPCWKQKEDGKCSSFCESCKADRREFEGWVKFIRKYGERQQMLKTVYIVLCVDEYQYWTMGDPMNTTWILNRALINEPRRKPKLYWLDRK